MFLFAPSTDIQILFPRTTVSISASIASIPEEERLHFVVFQRHKMLFYSLIYNIFCRFIKMQLLNYISSLIE